MHLGVCYAYAGEYQVMNGQYWVYHLKCVISHLSIFSLQIYLSLSIIFLFSTNHLTQIKLSNFIFSKCIQFFVLTKIHLKLKACKQFVYKMGKFNYKAMLGQLCSLCTPGWKSAKSKISIVQTWNHGTVRRMSVEFNLIPVRSCNSVKCKVQTSLLHVVTRRYVDVGEVKRLTFER